jgi:hypothetical protein
VVTQKVHTDEGKLTSARRKVQTKRRPSNCNSMLLSPQQGISWPLAPVKRGPDGEDVERWGKIL